MSRTQRLETQFLSGHYQSKHKAVTPTVSAARRLRLRDARRCHTRLLSLGVTHVFSVSVSHTSSQSRCHSRLLSLGVTHVFSVSVSHKSSQSRSHTRLVSLGVTHVFSVSVSHTSSQSRCHTSQSRCHTSQSRCQISQSRCHTSQSRCHTSQSRCHTRLLSLGVTHVFSASVCVRPLHSNARAHTYSATAHTRRQPIKRLPFAGRLTISFS